MKTIGIISTVGVPACYGGYETLVENLLKYKQSNNIQYQIYCSSKAYKVRQKTYLGANLKYIPLNANGPSALIYDSISLIHAYFTCDVIVSLGTVGCFLLPILKICSKKKVIVNLDGLDDKRDKWGKLARFIIGNARNIAAQKADLIISDNDMIKEYVKKVFSRDSKLIEYGGDNAFPIYDKERLKKYNLDKGGYCFKVARIEPENKIDVILEAFRNLPKEKFVLVGNWNKSEYGRNIKEKYSKYKNIFLLDPIYDPNEINLLRSNCKIYIHGHSAGGTNPSLVEAMYLKLPIIATDVSYNRSTTEDKALYFTDSRSLEKAICNLNNEVLLQIADNMYSIAQRRYLWSIIADKYEKLY